MNLFGNGCYQPIFEPEFLMFYKEENKMKAFFNIGLTLLLTIILFTSSYPSSAVKSTSYNKNLIETNLLIGISSENDGLKLSSINLAGDIKSDKSVIELLKVLNSDTNEKIRGAAALSLVKIGDERGIKAIEFASRFDNSTYVKKLCKMFFSYYVKNK